MAKPSITLDSKEEKLIACIPSAQKAQDIWARFEDRKRQAKEDRLALGKELLEVRNRLATKGCKGLFTRWLTVQDIPHDRAYTYIALAGGGKSKTNTKCYKRKLAFLSFQTRFGKAESNKDKLAILADLNSWVVREYRIKTEERG